MIIIANGKAISCSKAVKGANYIKLYDSSGNVIATFSGISDFSGYSLTDDSGNVANFTTDVTAEQKLQQLETTVALLDAALAKGAS